MKNTTIKKRAAKTSPTFGERLITNIQGFIADIESGKTIVIHEYSILGPRKTTLAELKKQRNASRIVILKSKAVH